MEFVFLFIIFVLSLMFVAILVKYYKKLLGLYCIRKDEDVKILQETIFFTNRSECVEHVFDKFCSSPYCAHIGFNKIRNYLVSGTESLDICVHLIVSWELVKIIIERHRSGIKVRVITDNRNAFDPRSKIVSLRKADIPVRMNKNVTSRMHAKFAIVDKKILLFGSLNWTLDGLCCNWENVIVTSSPYLVGETTKLFRSMWKEFH